jgi:hypothetical protein
MEKVKCLYRALSFKHTFEVEKKYFYDPADEGHGRVIRIK